MPEQTLLNAVQALVAAWEAVNLAESGQQVRQWLATLLAGDGLGQLSISAAASFALIATAEIGDKSQLVCMTLAARHKAMPVLTGAVLAFMLLNSLAVVFGAAVAQWLPDYWVAALVALLFASFGVHALWTKAEDEAGEVKEKSGHGVFLTTFLMITVAEFGDKTQLAVAALSSNNPPAAVWLGATAALGLTSALGIFAGRKVLAKIPLAMLHKISGWFFLALAALAGYQACASYLSRTLIP